MAHFEDATDADLLALIVRVSGQANPWVEDVIDMSEALREATRRGLRVDTNALVRWIGLARADVPEKAWRNAGNDAIAASASNDSAEVRDALKTVVADKDADGRVLAASILGHQHVPGCATLVLNLLRELVGETWKCWIGEFAWLTVTLEMLGDTAVAPAIQAMIADAPDWAVYWLARTIRRLTGHCPPPPAFTYASHPDAWHAQVRQDWLAVNLKTAANPRTEWTVTSPHIAEAVVTDGRDVFALEPDDAPLGWQMPKLDYSWRHDDQRLYETGSVCSCDVVLERVGWAPDEAVRLAQVVRQKVADVTQIDGSLMTALEPLVTALAAGRYQLRLVDLALQAATWRDTWFATGTPYYDSPTDPDCPVFQFDQKTRFVIAPTQPPSVTNPETVKGFTEAIKQGERPSAIIAAYSASRQPWDSTIEHHSVTGFIIDGHHKMAAYTSLGVPARAILICDRLPRQPALTDDPLTIFDELLAEHKIV